MQKIEAVIHRQKLDASKRRLLEIGIEGMTILEARAMAAKRATPSLPWREYTVDLLPKIKLES